MVERKRLKADAAEPGKSGGRSDDWYRERLQIDRDDLDTCLIEQPELYYHVIQAHVEAVAERDSAKLDLEEAEAAADRKIRDDFEQSGEKTTEARIQQELRLVPKLQTLRRKYTDLGSRVNHYAALKEAYQQRSFMLRELVSLYVSQSYDYGMSGGAAEAKARKAEQNRGAAGELRRSRRGM